MTEVQPEQSNARHRRRAPDRGTTFVEMLVAIVLLGTAIVGMLTALRTTIIGTTTERDHAKAHEWLQSASEVLSNDDIPWADCDAPRTGGQVAAEYELALQSGFPTIVPEGWGAGQVEIPLDVQFAGPSGAYGATCYAAIDRQLILLQVTDTDGEIVEQVEVVKAP